MKFGLSTLGCPEWTIEQAVASARENGYGGIELRVLDGEIITPSIVRQNLDRLKRLFGAGQPKLVGLGTSVRISTRDAAERATHEADLIAFLELAGELGVPFVRVFGGRWSDGDTEAAAVSRASQLLRRCAPVAEQAGVTIALETHDDFSRSRLVAATLAEVPSPAVGALWDVHHPYRMGEDLAQVWTALANRLVHVHLKDARRRPDGEWDLVLLGQGEVPCKEILRALAWRDYTGWVVMEWGKKWHPEIAGPEIAFPQHLARAKEWLADL